MANDNGGLSPLATTACAVTCGAMVANLYFAQPLITTIAPDLKLGTGAGGLIVTLTQLGYGAGLFFVVPLADRLENRRLIVTTLLLTALALAAVAFSPSRGPFLAACVALGVAASGAQVVVPFAASLTPEARRGRAVGNVMAGLLAGIMLARPAASLVAELAGWRWVFGLSAGVALATALWVREALPERRPEARESYPAILASLWHLMRDTPALQRRALYQGLVFAVFNIFWTAAPIELERRFGFGKTGIALFALAGAAGTLAAPIAGRLGDKGHVRLGTGLALATIAASMALAGWAGAAGSLWLLVLFSITLDGATQVNQVLGQRVIYTLPGDNRGRLNAIYMTTVFVLGAAGSAIATVAFDRGGWAGAAAAGSAIGLLVLAIFGTEFMPRGARRQPA